MSAFRFLAPLGESSASGASSSKQGQSPNNTSSTGPTSADMGGGNGGDPGKGGHGPSRRRRNAGTVAQKACVSCRHARQRCDGVEPNACSKCVQRRIPCVWEPHTKESKDDLIQQIVALQNRNKQMVEESARSEEESQNFRQTSEWQGLILSTIGKNGHDREIISRLREGQTIQAIADWLAAEDPTYRSLCSEPAISLSLTEVVQMFEDQCQAYDGLQQRDNLFSSKIPWTKVSTDHKLIGHLFDLYFTWVHPVHMLFNEMDFVRDFRESTQEEDTAYCGAALVNAICAMASHLLDNEKLQRGSQLVDVRRTLNAATLRKGFMSEAKRKLTPDTYGEMTSVQAFAVMYLVDWSSGKARSALGYLRAAAEIFDPSHGDQSEEAVEITYWGIKTLVTACVGTTYQNIHLKTVSTSAEVFNSVRMNGDSDIWRFYRQPGDEKEMPTRPGLGIVTACHQASLFRIADQIIQLYCGAVGKVKEELVHALYKKLEYWRDNLPDKLRIETQTGNPLPHVFYLHIQLHAIIVQLMNPIAQSGLFGGAQLQEIRKIIATHAIQGLGHIQRATRLYTARFHLPLLSFCCVHLADAAMVYEAQRGPEALQVSMHALQETRAGFDLCGPLQELLRQRAVTHSVQLPHDIAPLLGSLSHFGMDEILDACTRLTYTQPLKQILSHFEVDGAAEDPDSRRTSLHRQTPSTTQRMQIDALLND